MADLQPERFWVAARRHTLAEPPPEVRDGLLRVFTTWAAERRPAPVAGPLRQFVADLVRDLGGSVAVAVAVAGARGGGGGTRQLLHAWPDGEVTWALQRPAPDALKVVGQILAADESVTRWQVSGVIDGVVAARVDADATGEFELSVPAASAIAVHLHHDDVEVVCGPVRIDA